jgi:phosphate:Na+ symporter
MAQELLLFATSIALFLFAMVGLNTCMQRLLSVRVREYIKYTVRRPIYGLLTGIFSTIAFQSSSATTLLTVGMVSAGVISFNHSLGIILGADIGTTLTVQLVAWKITAISPVFILISGMAWVFGRGTVKSAGQIFFYFGLIFFSLTLTEYATAPLKENPTFLSFVQKAQHPVTGVAIGVIFTGIVQASSIPISILVIMAQNDLVTIQNALPIILGANMETTVTAFFAAAVSNINGRRTALAHFIFKLVGIIICFAFLPVAIPVFQALSKDVSQEIVLGHILYNCLIAALFFFILEPVASVIKRVFRGREAVVLSLWPEYLDEGSLQSPDRALEQVRKELSRGLSLTKRMLSESLELILSYGEGRKRDIHYVEMVVDNLQTEIAKYLSRISGSALSAKASRILFAFSAVVDDIERIGDRALNLAGLARYKYQSKADISSEAEAELDGISRMVFENLRDTWTVLEKGDKVFIESIVDRDKRIDVKVHDALQNHLIRFREGRCKAEAGPIFVDVLINLERISDHCKHIGLNLNLSSGCRHDKRLKAENGGKR